MKKREGGGLDLVAAVTTGICKKQVHTGERLGQRRQRPQEALGTIPAELYRETQLRKSPKLRPCWHAPVRLTSRAVKAE